MPLIGTAGHVDHGKSTLIETLTGRDPDRWAEEKRRGLTIDLGFAWTTLQPGLEVSFVDVPGHERYLKNMLAGIEVVDAALFVVAADEGWMPQSEEHLAVLDLLGIDRGVVALTKVDLVDDDIVDLATIEISEKLAGTSMESSEVIPVSARTGLGIDRLRSALADLVSGVSVGGDRPRLWIDRAFTVPGAGTVITGTLIEGPIQVKDTVEILPGHRTARVRALQSHETEVERAEPGRRLALNLSGIDRTDLPRGSMLGLPHQWRSTSRFSARLRLARYVTELPARGAFHLHFGSGAYPVQVRRHEGDAVLLEVSSPLPMRTGDRFVLRDTGRRLVMAGGMVVDPSPRAPARALADVSRIDPRAGRDRIATDLLAVRGIDDLARLAAHSGGGSPIGAIEVGQTAVTQGRFDELRAEVEMMVSRQHVEHPLRAGVPSATLATSLDIGQDLVDRIVEESPGLSRIGPDVASIDHQQDLDDQQRESWAEAQTLLRSALTVPNTGDLGLDPELLHLLIRHGQLVRISDDLVFLPEQIDQLREAIGEMKDGFTVAEFRDQSGLSRKYAVPILEWSDREGLTFRRGDLRHLR
ncbi:MAG TPA: selenocysteine-specific translation elongation factor [Acidimicrobiia bacterium]|nr:selenocysteine-specific translation elongation factor [Acidimicrobiia bacterium]